MVISYSKAMGQEGVLIDAVAINKYHEMGNPTDPGYPDDFDGIPGIRIHRRCGKVIELLYRSKEDRDAEYENLLTQVRRQTIPAH